MANEFPALVYVDLVKSKLPRKQPFRWVAKSGDNQRRLAVSGEWYTNRRDAVDAIYLLFGDASNVFLRQSELGNVVLRRAA